MELCNDYNIGGEDGVRTRDLLHAMQALSQLSYIPVNRETEMVGRAGVEPATRALSGLCSTT